MTTWVSWSGGKDGALALAVTRERGPVAGLHTTVLAGGEVAASYVPRAFVEAQAAALGLPLETVELPSPCPNEVYEERTGASWAALRGRGATEVVYGDLFLADIRAFRERALAATGLIRALPALGAPDGRAGRARCSTAGCARSWSASTRAGARGVAGRAWDAELLARCPRASTRAARTASSTPSSPTGRASRIPSPRPSPAPASATGS